MAGPRVDEGPSSIADDDMASIQAWTHVVRVDSSNATAEIDISIRGRLDHGVPMPSCITGCIRLVFTYPNENETLHYRLGDPRLLRHRPGPGGHGYARRRRHGDTRLHGYRRCPLRQRRDAPYPVHLGAGPLRLETG